MKIITVTGFKGGVSKSTTAVHLATYLSELGETVLVDGDPNRTAVDWAEHGGMPFAVVDENNQLKATRNADYVVIDTPARPDSKDLEELAGGCDLLILPTTPDVVSLRPMLQTAGQLEGANYRMLLSIVPPHPSKEGETMQAELQAAEVPVFKAMIRRAAAFQKAALAGLPVRDLTGRDRIPWNDYKRLGDEVMEALGNE